MITPLRKVYSSEFLPNVNFGTETIAVTFEVVPPGSIWTGTISAVATQTITPGITSPVALGTNSNNDLLANIIWTLYRNGTAEYTWTGYSMLVNVQGFGNDVFTLIGEQAIAITPVVFNDANPVTVTVTYSGYVGDEWEIPLVVPFLSTSVTSAPNAAYAMPSAAPQVANLNGVGPGTYAMILAPPVIAGVPPQIQLWSAQLSLAVSALTTQGVTASITDAFGVVYFSIEAQTETGGAGPVGTTSTSNGEMDMRGIPIPGSALFPINLVVSPSIANVRCSCTIYWAQTNFIF